MHTYDIGDLHYVNNAQKQFVQACTRYAPAVKFILYK